MCLLLLLCLLSGIRSILGTLLCLASGLTFLGGGPGLVLRCLAGGFDLLSFGLGLCVLALSLDAGLALGLLSLLLFLAC